MKKQIFGLIVVVLTLAFVACPEPGPDKQTPVATDYDIGNLTQTAGSVTAVTVTPKAGKSTGAVTVQYNGSATIPQTAGNYAVTFNVAAAAGWDAATGLYAGLLSINTAGSTNQTPMAGDYYIGNLTQTAGSVTAVTVTPKAGKSTGTVSNIQYNGSATIPQIAGTYAVTFNVAAVAGWNAANGLSAGTLTINSKITPTVTTWPTATAITYGAALSTSALTGGTANVAGSFAWSDGTIIPTVINSGYQVTFTPTDTINYNTVKNTVGITVNKVDQIVTTWPTAAAITYGAALSTSALTGGAASVAGSFSWANGTTIPTVSNSGYQVTFTPTDTDHYNTATNTVNITVNKATPTVTVWPTAAVITYGATLSTSALNGGTASVAGSFAWANGANIPAVSNSGYQVTFTPNDADNYNTVTNTVNITVNKATPTVTVWPTAAVITYGATLSTSALNGGTASVAGSFAWVNGANIPAVSNSGYQVTFTPTDTNNFNIVTSSSNVSITVYKADPIVTTWPTAAAITIGETLIKSSLSGGTASVSGSFVWANSATIPTFTNSGYPVIFIPTDTANYNTLTQNVALTVNNKVTPTVTTWPTAAAITYGAALSTSALTGGVASVAGSFAWSSPSSIPTVTNSGYQVTFTPTDTDHFNTATSNINITVHKATPTVTTWPPAAAITYGAALSSSALSGGSANVPGSFAWTNDATIPTVTNSGYQVTFTPNNANYNMVTNNVNITVNKAAPTVTSWPISAAITYGAALSTSALSGGTASVNGSFAWTNGATIPTVTNSGYQATFTPTDTANYNTVTNTVNITVNKATPTVTVWPTAATITYGAALSTSALTGGAASINGANVNGSFAWTNGATMPTVTNSGYQVTFTPYDTNNYNTVINTLNITVNKAAGATVNAPTELSKTYNSITINAVTAPSNGQTVEYARNDTPTVPSTGWQNGTTFNGLGAGTTYYFFARSVANDNYNIGTASVGVGITTLQIINPAEIVVYYWVNEQDVLATTNGNTTLSPGQRLSITAQGTGYTNRQWYLNGINTGLSGTTYNFSSTITGKHTVVLFVEKGGKLYNTSITITVQ